eukprot:5911264-Amphidinium_carterae.1
MGLLGFDRRALPLHVVFTVDCSCSMNKRDVDGRSRLTAVLEACRSFMETHRDEVAEGTNGVANVFSLVTFNEERPSHSGNALRNTLRLPSLAQQTRPSRTVCH